MSDKTREDFEYWASDDGEYPSAVERSGHGYKLAQIQTYWQAWQAAKELYEPKWISVEERMPEPFVHVALIDAERHQNCPDVMNGRDHIKDIGYYNPEWKCWSVRGQPGFSKPAYTHWLPLPPIPSAHSTQGGGE